MSIVAELPALEGRSRGVVRASWDPELSAVMLAAGRAGHEELVLDELLNDLQET